MEKMEKLVQKPCEVSKGIRGKNVCRGFAAVVTGSMGVSNIDISSSVIPYAIKIAKGMSFLLAPLYLGFVYKRMDSFVVPNPKVQLHVSSISSNDVWLRFIHSKRNKTSSQGKSTPSGEVEGLNISEFESGEESCDHTNDYESSDKSIEERLPKHEYLSLGGEVDGNAI
ncbi:Uncharacterized protein TCM_024365 [Theobroma cacao]|uniref:Uncharacterized protein n=1 Tax=Theobroma cacao TaxID=3641 RepID=A0A061F3C4_THECC|nr:Uncharacterized protein TCM_024365 [Theobroma cacao]